MLHSGEIEELELLNVRHVRETYQQFRIIAQNAIQEAGMQKVRRSARRIPCNRSFPSVAQPSAGSFVLLRVMLTCRGERTAPGVNPVPPTSNLEHENQLNMSVEVLTRRAVRPQRRAGG